MKTAIGIFLSALFLLGLRAWGAAPADQNKLSAANAGFAFKFLKQLNKEQPGCNVFISPFSLSSALQLIETGAAGQTKAEIQAVLGIKNLEPNAASGSYRDIAASLNTRSNSITLTTANSIWHRKGLSVRPEFIAQNQQFFGSTIEPLDFNDPRSADAINAWVSERTHGKINTIADGGLLGATDLFLVNAVYFKGKWAVPFDASKTKARAFHLRTGREAQVAMMEQSRKFTYRKGTGYQAVHLLYKDWSLGMYVFLPDIGSSPEKLLGIMSGDTWMRVTKPGFEHRQGTLLLPKFRLEYQFDLKSPLNAMGIKAAFGRASFPGISSQPLYISGGSQRAIVEVNEEGTEAAAVTGLEVPVMGIEIDPPKPFQMFVDRPFLILIEDEQTQTILFMGIVYDPQ